MAIEIEGAPLKMRAEIDTKDFEQEFRKSLQMLQKENDEFWKKVKQPSFTPKGGGEKIKNIIDEKTTLTIQQAISSLDQLGDKSKLIAEKLAALKTETQSLAEAKKALNVQLSQGDISNDQYQKALAAVEMQQATVRNSLTELNREVSQSVKLEKAAAGSLEEARIKYNQLTAAITRAGGAMDGSNPAVSKMVEKHQALRKEIDAMEQKMGMYQRNVGNYASGWNGLQNSINQVTRELPSFTYSAQTGFMAISNNLPVLVDELKKAADANKALTAEGKKGTPVWKQLVGSLFSWQTAMMAGITLLTVYGKEIGEWIATLTKGKKQIDEAAESQKALNEALKDSEYRKAVTEIKTLETAVNLAKKGFVSKTSVVEEYNKTIGQSAGELKTLQEVEQFLINNADNYVKMTLYKAAANKALDEAAKGAYEAQMAQMKTAEESLTWTQKVIDRVNRLPGLGGQGMRYDPTQSANNAKKDMERMGNATRQAAIDEGKKTENTQTKIADELLKKSQEYANKMGISIFGDHKKNKNHTSKSLENQYESLLKISRDGIAKIKALDNEYRILEFDDDKREIEALRQKFADFRQVLEEENKKIIEGNKKLKGNKKVSLIDISAVDPIAQRAESDLVYNQQTKHLEKELETQKKIVDDFEDYKSKLGKDKANERYKSELGLIKGYKEKLQSERLKLLSTNQTASLDGSAPSKLTQPQEERLKIIDKLLEEEKQKEEKAQTDLLASMIAYDTKRKLIIEKYEEDKKSIIGVASKEELEEFEKAHQQEINDLDDSNIKKLQSYTELFEGIEKLTDAGARRVIENAKLMLSSAKDISPELRKDIEKALKQAEDSLDSRLPERIQDMSDAFSKMAQSVRGVNEELSNMLQGVSNVLDSIVQVDTGFKNLKSGLDNWKEQKNKGGGGILGTVSAFAGVAGAVGQIAGAVGKVVGGVINFFKASKESARQAADQIAKYQESVLTGELEYNRVLRERARQQKNINELTSEQIKLQQKLINSQSNEVERDFNAVLSKIQREGQQITGQKTEKYGGFLGIGKKSRVIDITKGLSGYTYEELEKLYSSNKLTEATRKQFEELQKLKNEVDDIAEAWDNAQKELISRMSGGITSDAITKSIIDGFRNGKRAVTDFADDMESIIQNALISAMAFTYLDEPIKKLVDDFQKNSLDGLDEKDINDFENGYKRIIETGTKQLEAIEKVLGKSLGDSADQGLKGRITPCTEQSVSQIKYKCIKIKINI